MRQAILSDDVSHRPGGFLPDRRVHVHGMGVHPTSCSSICSHVPRGVLLWPGWALPEARSINADSMSKLNESADATPGPSGTDPRTADYAVAPIGEIPAFGEPDPPSEYTPVITRAPVVTNLGSLIDVLA